MTDFRRYAIRKTLFKSEYNDGTPYYYAIGKGGAADISEAHLYTNIDLAKKQLESMWKADNYGLIKLIEIIEVGVAVGDVIVSRTKTKKVRNN